MAPVLNFQLLVTVCLITLTTDFIGQVQTQVMPEYDDYPEPRPPMDSYGHGMDPHGHGMDPHGHGMDPYGRGGPHGEGKKNEVIVGTKRFKLYEKKRLNFKRAKEFCRKKEGKLAEARTIDEMRRLESLFMRARMIGMDVWVGADKKQWKKHSMKEVTHPGLNLNKSGMDQAGIRAMMMGGGQKEMCPAISLSTRNMAPVMCAQPLPFICEYDRNKPKPPKKPKSKAPTSKPRKPTKKKSKRKDEMK